MTMNRKAGKAGKSGRRDSNGATAGNGMSLQARALAAMQHAYAPYSRFRVGAALLGADGSVTEACNVENAAIAPKLKPLSMSPEPGRAISRTTR